MLTSATVAADTRNKAPVFDDQDDDEDGIQNTETTRTVAENTDAPNSVGRRRGYRHRSQHGPP